MLVDEGLGGGFVEYGYAGALGGAEQAGAELRPAAPEIAMPLLFIQTRAGRALSTRISVRSGSQRYWVTRPISSRKSSRE
jgi:hypothetical protein